MKLVAAGWSRHVSSRKLFDVDLSQAHVADDYKWDGVTVQRITDIEKMRHFLEVDVADAPPPALGYRFRIHVGESTMGGDYSADLLVGADDVLAMFRQMFGHLTVGDMLHLLRDKA